jgi:ubiquinone/menaquinone biosynthesis C-methylase UbiE
MNKSVRRPGVREGYDLWAPTYDRTPNPLVFLDRIHTLSALDPAPGERILDAGCGTGYHLSKMHQCGAHATGVDFSYGMLAHARSNYEHAELIQADLHHDLPFRDASFDAALSALVSEHITDLSAFCCELYRVLRPRGRFVWSVFHPALAHAGVEANFTTPDAEIRLGAEQHTREEYEGAIESNGFSLLTKKIYEGTPAMSNLIARAEKYEGQPLLIIYTARRA